MLGVDHPAVEEVERTLPQKGFGCFQFLVAAEPGKKNHASGWAPSSRMVLN